MVANPAIEFSRLKFGLARQVRSSRPEPARLSGLSRVYQVNVKQIASRWHSLLDSVREFAWTGPVVLKMFE